MAQIRGGRSVGGINQGVLFILVDEVLSQAKFFVLQSYRSYCFQVGLYIHTALFQHEQGFRPSDDELSIHR